jgi:hypothetical protein
MNDDQWEVVVMFEKRASEWLWRSLYPNFFSRFEGRLHSVALLVIIVKK